MSSLLIVKSAELDATGLWRWHAYDRRYGCLAS